MKTTISVLFSLCMVISLAQNPPAPRTYPTATFAGKSSGLITRAEVAATDKLGVMVAPGSVDTTMFVTGYKFSIFRRGKMNPIQDVTIRSDSVTKYFKDCLFSSPAGSKFYLEYLTIRTPGRTDIKAPPLSFELAD